mmetsp:Transcript_18854/g.29480  ORF Transcript_18854/g.29480 Transcript_18854/m.29480 type:complete len:84 (-) Transcript_18854:1588-1839(-)
MRYGGTGGAVADSTRISVSKDLRSAAQRLNLTAAEPASGGIGSSSKKRPVTLRDLGINGEEDEEFTNFLAGFQRDIRKIGQQV